MVEEQLDKIEVLTAENAKLRAALEKTQHHLAKLVKGNPDGWLAAQRQVLANRELLAALHNVEG